MKAFPYKRVHASSFVGDLFLSVQVCDMCSLGSLLWLVCFSYTTIDMYFTIWRGSQPPAVTWEFLRVSSLGNKEEMVE